MTKLKEAKPFIAIFALGASWLLMLYVGSWIATESERSRHDWERGRDFLERKCGKSYRNKDGRREYSRCSLLGGK
jgi:hypothetical protein